MSAIDEKIKKLREQERQLELEKRKVEFLQHILASAKKYEHKDFEEVKNDVILLLIDFVENAVKSIENGAPVQVAQAPIPVVQKTIDVAQSVQPAKEADLSPNEKLNFALEHRHLANKKVSIANDQNIVISGLVVGLDAPHVIVKTDTGPTIKVPLNKVSLQ